MTSLQPMIYQLVSSYSHPSEQIIESVIQTIVSKVSNVDSSTSTTSLDVVTTLYPTKVANNTTHLEHSWTPVRHSFIPHLQQTLPAAAALLVSAPALSTTSHNDQFHQRKRSRPRTLRVLPRLLRVGGVSVDRAEWVTNATRDCLNAGHYPYFPINSTLGESPTVLPALATVEPISRAIIDTQVPQKGYPSPPGSAGPRADPLAPAIASTLALVVPEPSSQSLNFCPDAINHPTDTHTPKDHTPCPSCCRVTSIPLPLSLAPLAAVEMAISRSTRDSPDSTPHAYHNSHTHTDDRADLTVAQEPASTLAYTVSDTLPRLCMCCARHELSPLAHAVMQPPATRPALHALQTYAHADAARAGRNCVDKVRMRPGTRASLSPGAWLRAPGPVAGVCVRVWAHIGGACQCVEEWRVAVRSAGMEAGVSSSADEAGTGSILDINVRSLRALLTAAAQSVGAVDTDGHRLLLEEEAEDEREGLPSLAALLYASSDGPHAAAMQNPAGAGMGTNVAAAATDGDGAADTRAMLTTILRALSPRTHAPTTHHSSAPSMTPDLAPFSAATARLAHMHAHPPSHAPAPAPSYTPAPPALGLASLLRAVSTVAGGVLPALAAEASANHSRAWASVSVEPLLACVAAGEDLLAREHPTRSRGASASLPLAATWRTLLPVHESVHVSAHSHTSVRPRTLQLGSRRTSLALCVELRRHPHPHRALRHARAHVPLAVPDVCPRWQRWELWCAALRSAWADLERHSAAMISNGATASGAPPTSQPGSAPAAPGSGAPTASAAAVRALALAAVFGGLPLWLTQPHCDADADADTERAGAGAHATGDSIVTLDTHATHQHQHHSVGGPAWADAIAAVRLRLHEGQELLQESVPQALALAGAVAARGWRRVGAREAWQAMGAAGLRAVVAAGDDKQRREVTVLAQTTGARGSGDVRSEDEALVSAARAALQPCPPLLPYAHHARHLHAHTSSLRADADADALLSISAPLASTATAAATEVAAAHSAATVAVDTIPTPDAVDHSGDESHRGSAAFDSLPTTATDTENAVHVIAQADARTGACLSPVASAGMTASIVPSARGSADTPCTGSTAVDVAACSSGDMRLAGSVDVAENAEDAESTVTLSPAHTPTPTHASTSMSQTPPTRTATAAAVAAEASPLTAASPSSPPLPLLAAHTPTRVHAHASLARHLSSYVSSGSLSSLASIGSISLTSLTSLSLSMSLSLSLASPSGSPMHSHAPSAASSPSCRPPALTHTRTDGPADTDAQMEAEVGAEVGVRVRLLAGHPTYNAQEHSARAGATPAVSPAYSMSYSLPDSLPDSTRTPPRIIRRRSSGPRTGGGGGDSDGEDGGAEGEGGRDGGEGETAPGLRQHALQIDAVECMLVTSAADVTPDVPSEVIPATAAPAISTDTCSTAGSLAGSVRVAGEPVRTPTHTVSHATAPDALHGVVCGVVDAASGAALVSAAPAAAAGHTLAPLPLLAVGSGNADGCAGADADAGVGESGCVVVSPFASRAPLLATPLATPAHTRAAAYACPSTLARAASRVADTSHPRLSKSLSKSLSTRLSSPSFYSSSHSSTSTSTTASSGSWRDPARGLACVAVAGDVSHGLYARPHTVVAAGHEKSVAEEEEEGLDGGDVVLVEEVCMLGQAPLAATVTHIHHTCTRGSHSPASGHGVTMSNVDDGGEAAVSVSADGMCCASGWNALRLLETQMRRDADLIVVASTHTPTPTSTHARPVAGPPASPPLWPHVSLRAAAVEALALALGEADGDDAYRGYVCGGAYVCGTSTVSSDSVTNDRASASTCAEARVCACVAAVADVPCVSILRPPVRSWRLARVSSQPHASTGIGADVVASACGSSAIDDPGLKQHPPGHTFAPLKSFDDEDDSKIDYRNDSKTVGKGDIKADDVATVCAVSHSLVSACARSDIDTAVLAHPSAAVVVDASTVTADIDDQRDDTGGDRSIDEVVDTCDAQTAEAHELCAHLEREAAEAVAWLPLHGLGTQGYPWGISTLFL